MSKYVSLSKFLPMFEAHQKQFRKSLLENYGVLGANTSTDDVMSQYGQSIEPSINPVQSKTDNAVAQNLDAPIAQGTQAVQDQYASAQTQTETNLPETNITSSGADVSGGMGVLAHNVDENGVDNKNIGATDPVAVKPTTQTRGVLASDHKVQHGVSKTHQAYKHTTNPSDGTAIALDNQNIKGSTQAPRFNLGVLSGSADQQVAQGVAQQQGYTNANATQEADIKSATGIPQNNTAVNSGLNGGV